MHPITERRPAARSGAGTLTRAPEIAGHRAEVVGDLPHAGSVLPAEDRLALLRSEYMDLLEAARAAVAAAWAGEEYPLSHLVALLGHKGQLPEAGAPSAAVRSSAQLPGVVA